MSLCKAIETETFFFNNFNDFNGFVHICFKRDDSPRAIRKTTIRPMSVIRSNFYAQRNKFNRVEDTSSHKHEINTNTQNIKDDGVDINGSYYYSKINPIYNAMAIYSI